MPTLPLLPAWARVVVVGVVIAIVTAIGWLFGSAVVTSIDDFTSTGDILLLVPTAAALVIFLAGSAALGLLLRTVGLTPRVLVCWGVVAVAFATLVALAKQDSVTSSSLYPPTVGAYVRDGDRPLLGNPSVLVHSDGLVELDSPAIGFEDHHPRVIWYLYSPIVGQVKQFMPDSCRPIDEDLYDCPAGDRIYVPEFVEPRRIALAERALAIEVVARSRADLSALNLTVEFPTYELDPSWQGAMSFDHVVAGGADLTTDAIVFRSQEQGASESWIAAIAVRLNAADSAFSILRDLLLVILGGAVTLTLRPRRGPVPPASTSVSPRSQRVSLSSRPETRRRATLSR